MAKIFWDTNLFIYLFADHPEFGPRVQKVRRQMLARGDQLCTSSLTVGEILVKPFEEGDTKLAEQYRRFFENPVLTVIPFDLKAAALYPRVRQDRSISRPDAIQLACGAAAEVDLFVTNDSRLSGKVVPGIKFLVGLDRVPF